MSSFGSPTASTCSAGGGIGTLTAPGDGVAATARPDDAVSAGLKARVPEPCAVMAGPAGSGQSGALRHWPSSASHSKVGSPSALWSPMSQRRSQPTTRVSTRLLSPCVRQTPWPPQNHSMCTGTPLALIWSKLRIASLGVKRVSAVPCTSSVGTRICETSASPGPRLSNQARSSADRWPVASPSVSAETMCGSTVPVCTPAGLMTPSAVAVGMPRPDSAAAQPPLTMSSR